MVGKVVYFRNRESNVIFAHAAFYFPDNHIKPDSIPLRPSTSRRQKQVLPKTPDILTVPTITNPISLIDAVHIPVRNHIDIIPQFSNIHINEGSTDCNESIPKISTKIQQLPHMNQMVDNDENFQNFSQFFDRWRVTENATSRKLSTIQTNSDTKQSWVHKKSYKPADGKR